MSRFDEISRVVTDAIKTGRVGAPVFLRIVATLSDVPADRLGAAARWVSAIEQWVGDSIDTLHAVSAGERGAMSIAVQFRGGATALLSSDHSGPTLPRLDLILLGNHGAVYLEGLRAASPGLIDPGERVRPEVVGMLQGVLGRSLQRGAPERLPEERP